jgi:hypothetical protein
MRSTLYWCSSVVCGSVGTALATFALFVLTPASLLAQSGGCPPSICRRPSCLTGCGRACNSTMGGCKGPPPKVCSGSCPAKCSCISVLLTKCECSF